MRITGGENSWYTRAMRAIGCNTTPTVQLNGEIHQQPALYGTGEAHRQQYQIRFQLEVGARQSRVVRVPVGEYPPLETRGVNPLHSPILAGERGGGNAPLAIATLLVRM